MDEELIDRLKQIKTEDYIWVIYLIIIAFSFYSNVVERHYLIFKDEMSKIKYRYILMGIFLTALIIYIYYLIGSYKDIKNLKSTDSYSKKNLTQLSFVASFLIVISGIIFLYIAYNDKDVEIELAFN